MTLLRVPSQRSITARCIPFCLPGLGCGFTEPSSQLGPQDFHGIHIRSSTKRLPHLERFPPSLSPRSFLAARPRPSFLFISQDISREMPSSNPALPSITFVLSQEQPATTRSGKRRGKFGTRRIKSSSSFTPHPPRYPPRLDSEFLKVNSFAYFLFQNIKLPSFRVDREFASFMTTTHARRP